MRCEKVTHKFNDLLDRALSASEENEINAHLALCPNCRGEFQLVKNADDMLRSTVLEMLAEIEVPSNLSQRIGQALAGEKKRQSGKARLLGLLQAPAFAVAVLLLVVVTGFLGYYKLFDPSIKNPAVVLSLPQDQPVSGIAGEEEPAPQSATSQEQSSIKDGITTEAPYRIASPLVTKTQVADGTANPTSDAGSRSAEAIDRQNSPSNPKEKAAAGLAQNTGTEELSKPMVSSQSSRDAKLFISSMAAPSQGTLEEATRGVGFTPAVPGYLPSGAELKDVTWKPGSVYLEYRKGSNSFSLTQSRFNGFPVTGEGGGQFIDINGSKAQLQETSPNGDQKWGYTTVRWQDGEWLFTVGGDLPREEILKIALSIK